MARLTDVAYKTRKIIKFGSIGLVTLFFLKIFIQAGIAYWKKLHPPPPPPPTVAFGKLIKMQFPPSKTPTLNYILELPTGDFPSFTDRAKVFVVINKRVSFLAWDEAKKEASGLGFTQESEAVSAQVYRWVKKTPLASTLELNIINGSFEFEYNWQEDPNILAQKNPPGEQQAINETKGFLSGMKNLEQDLSQGEAKVDYLKVAGTKLLPALSSSEADFVKVDLFRANIEDLPVLTPDPSQGLVSALLSSSPEKRFLKVTFDYLPVNYSLFATYPLKTAAEAWQELKDGKGYVASFPEKMTNIVVRRIYLGYLDTFSPQPYLQPIFIFKGDNDFIGYVPAIIDSWYQ